MRITVEGLILSETVLKESDKFLTVLTREGKLSVYASHVRSIKRGSLAYTMPLQYCRFIINKRGDRLNLAEGEVLHSFIDLQDDLCAYSLAQYVLDITREMTVENNDESEMLQLALNTLYCIKQKNKENKLIKATFEFRAMAIGGYMPDLSGCGYCQKENDKNMLFDIMNGRLICGECSKLHDMGDTFSEDMGTAIIICPVTPSVVYGLRYVLCAPANRIFSYSIAEDELDDYAKVCEKYILNHLERGFATLDFYHEVSELFDSE